MVDTDLQIICYADDTVIYYPIANDYDLNYFKTESSKILNWFNYNHLALNSSKSILINFYLRKNLLQNITSLYIAGYDLKLLEKVKYLGIIFDRNLKFNYQYNKLLSCLNLFIKQFYHLSNYLSKSILTKIYMSFILPIIEYCGTVYLCRSVKYFRRILKLNNKLLNFTTIINLSLDKRFYTTACLIIYKIVNNLYPQYLKIFLKNHNFPTRSKCLIPLFNNNNFKFAFISWGSRVYNNLDDEFFKLNCVQAKKFLQRNNTFFSSLF
jgi:hypothetical protein